ncbi:MAG: hypothetical protein U0Q15_04990 [Kineosporiaceae bacterium]
MRRERPARRVAAASLLLALAGAGTAVTGAVAASDADSAREARAVAAAQAVVLDGDAGRGRVRVRWQDLAGREHTSSVRVRDARSLPAGAALPVRYDPGDPKPRALGPATGAHAAPLTPRPVVLARLLACALGLGAAVVTAAGWDPAPGAGTVGRARPRAPDERRPHGRAARGARGARGRRVAVVGAPARRRRPAARSALQRVVWHPRSTRCRPARAPVTVHGARLDARSPVTVVLPDGVRLVPVGRLRADAPRRVPSPAWSRDARTHLRPDAGRPLAGSPATPRPEPAGRRPARPVVARGVLALARGWRCRCGARAAARGRRPVAGGGGRVRGGSGGAVGAGRRGTVSTAGPSRCVHP